MTQDDTKRAPGSGHVAQRQSAAKKKVDERELALAKVAAIQAEAEELKARSAPERTKREGDWYVECTKCHSPALFLTEYPEGDTVQPDMWYSSYKTTDGVYVSDKLPCQVCKFPVQCKMHGDGSFLPLRRAITCTLQKEQRQKEADLERRKILAQKQIVVMNEQQL